MRDAIKTNLKLTNNETRKRSSDYRALDSFRGTKREDDQRRVQWSHLSL